MCELQKYKNLSFTVQVDFDQSIAEEVNSKVLDYCDCEPLDENCFKTCYNNDAR